MIPTPQFFNSEWTGLLRQDIEKRENLLLWQKMTSGRIPLSDIEQVVYKSDYETLYDLSWRRLKVDRSNKFYSYIINVEDAEIIDFLVLAKELEEKRAKYTSPWYYPASKGETIPDDFQYIINSLSGYEGTRLKDRYALQAVRALFAARRYDECVAYFDKSFKVFPETNLFKRMAMRYVAGCWYRMGDFDRANGYFAQIGDFASLNMDNPIAYMADRNPDNPELMQHIQSLAEDSAKFTAIKPVAENVLRGTKVKNRGDWEFALSYMYGRHYHDYREASRYIYKALEHKFSSKDLRDHARAYRIKIDAENGAGPLLADLKWFDSKIGPDFSDAKEWNRMMRNIVYSGWVPELWRNKKYTTAVLLCGYADNLLNTKQYHEVSRHNGTSWQYKSMKLDEIRCSERYRNRYDYRNLSFQLMCSLSSSQLIRVKQNISSDNELYALLRKYARTDADYLNELIGTLALREEKYQRAVYYLGLVSDAYLKTMNIYKEGYLKRDPFYAPESWAKKENGKWETSEYPCLLRNQKHSKYDFAKRMASLQNQMRNGKTADERGMARLHYAIGRYNSFEWCWALTQYWRGEEVGLFEPVLPDIGYRYDGVLYDYYKTVGSKITKDIYLNEVKAALAMLESDEVKAEAEYIMGRPGNVICKYGSTATAQAIRSSCDDWQSWL